MVSHRFNIVPSMQQTSHHTDKVRAQPPKHREANSAAQTHRQAFHHPRTSYGAAGHWIKTAGILAPLVIGEFIKDPDKKWRAIRIASVATALVSEGMWTHKIHKEREQARERELACEMSCGS
jgi:hypothetical protein